MNYAAKIISFSLIGLGLAMPAHAARPTYSFLELGYLTSDYPEAVKADGGRFNFNVSLERWIYFTGEYNHADYNDSDLQLRQTSLGFGTHTTGRDFQLFGAATYERSDVFGGNDTDEGYAVQLGLRWEVFGSDLELGGDVKWLNFGKALTVDRHRGTLQWRMSPTWAAVGTYQHTNYPGFSAKDWTVGFRAYFTTQYDLAPRRAAPDTR